MKHYGLLTLKHLFALFSIVGGHWLNGQYKKGIFFSLLLLALAWIGAKGTLDLFGYYIRYIITQDNIQIFYTDHPLLFMIFPLVALAIIVAALLSYYHYWKDLRSAPPKIPSLTFRCIYALLLTFAMLAVPISSGVGIFNTLKQYDRFNGSAVVSSLKSDWFRSLKFAENKLEASQHHLEPRDGQIHGTLMYQQKPVSNAELYIRWQGVEESSWVRTNATGSFKLSLPLGRWHIQRIQVSGEKKDADLAAGWLSSVGKQAIDAELGLQIDVKKDHIAELNLQFSDPIKLLFPAPAKFEQPISISDGQIRWQEVEGAQSYKVEIHRFNAPVGKAKLGGYNSMSEVASRVTMNHDFIALNAFHHVHNPQKKNEYTVTVIARDVYGQVISETSSRAREEHSFLVQDDIIFISDANLDPSLSKEEAASIYWQQESLHQAEQAIGKSDFITANSLLGKVKNAKLGQQKVLILGYLAAKQGRCDEADLLFEKYNEMRNHHCMMNSYRAACVTP